MLSGVKGMKVYGEGWIKKFGRLSKENKKGWAIKKEGALGDGKRDAKRR